MASNAISQGECKMQVVIYELNKAASELAKKAAAATSWPDATSQPEATSRLDEASKPDATSRPEAA